MADRYLYDLNGDVSRSIVTHESDPEGQFHIHTQQDLEPVIAEAAALRDFHAHIGHRKSRNMIPVAEIPLMIYEQAMREGWANDEAAWKRWLNDPQNRLFRITEGRV